MKDPPDPEHQATTLTCSAVPGTEQQPADQPAGPGGGARPPAGDLSLPESADRRPALPRYLLQAGDHSHRQQSGKSSE